MCKPGLMLLVAVALSACGGNPGDDQAAQQPPPATQSTELRDAAQAPLERAEGVQQTLDERAAKLDAETRAALDPSEDPNVTKDKKDDHEDEE
jgi:hypothetical protein